MRRRGEDKRARLQHVRQRARIVLRVWRDLGDSDIACRLHEPGNSRLVTGCDRSGTVDRHAMNGRFFRVMPVRTHPEGAARDPFHVGMRRLFPGRSVGSRFRSDLKHHAGFPLDKLRSGNFRTPPDSTLVAGRVITPSLHHPAIFTVSGQANDDPDAHIASTMPSPAARYQPPGRDVPGSQSPAMLVIVMPVILPSVSEPMRRLAASPRG